MSKSSRKKTKIELAAGSTVGSEHIGAAGAFVFHPNQDAYATAAVNDCEQIAIVCDGSSAGTNSHVGSHMGAKLLVSCLQGQLQGVVIRNQEQFAAVLKVAQNKLVAEIRRFTKGMQADGEEYEEILKEFFLFTVVGLFIGKRYTSIFSLGDGAFGLNNDIWTIGPFPENRPPYIAYNTVTQLRAKFAEQLDFEIQLFEPTSEMESAWIGTDGVSELFETSSDSLLDEYFANDAMFSNPALLSRKLRMLNIPRLDLNVNQTQNGLAIEKCTTMGPLSDDTTIVLARKKVLFAPPAPAAAATAPQATSGTANLIRQPQTHLSGTASAPQQKPSNGGLLGLGSLFGGKRDDTFVD